MDEVTKVIKKTGLKLYSNDYYGLTKIVKDKICNGCKPEWLPKNWDFDLIYEDECNHHDWDGWIGGTEKDRKRTDKSFLKRMLKAARKWHRKQIDIDKAITYKKGKFKELRKKIDKLKALLKRQAKYNYYKYSAYKYYLLVRAGGWTTFNFGEKRNLNDLLKLIG